MNTRAMLLVMTEPAASHEEEFNDWYDTEHFPQRRAVPGFESASRWVCLHGWPRWLAMYDVSGLDVFDSAAYRAISGANSTPWSKRVLSRTIGRVRAVARAFPDNAPLQAPIDQTASLLLLRYALGPSAGSGQSAVESLPMPPRAQLIRDTVKAAVSDMGLLQLRGFLVPSADASPAPPAFPGADPASIDDLWLLAAFDNVIDIAALPAAVRRPAGCGAKWVNLYAPYLRSGY